MCRHLQFDARNVLFPRDFWNEPGGIQCFLLQKSDGGRQLVPNNFDLPYDHLCFPVPLDAEVLSLQPQRREKDPDNAVDCIYDVLVSPCMLHVSDGVLLKLLLWLAGPLHRSDLPSDCLWGPSNSHSLLLTPQELQRQKEQWVEQSPYRTLDTTLVQFDFFDARIRSGPLRRRRLRYGI